MKTAHQNAPTPQQNQDVANKGYVDSVSGGGSLTLKEQVRPANGPSPFVQFQALAIKTDSSRVYVAAQDQPSQAWHFATATNKWETTPPVPLTQIFQMLPHPSGTKMYVLTNTDRQNVYIVDTATNTVLGTMSGGPLPGFGYNTMAIQPGTNELWVHYDTGPNFVARFDTTTDAYIASFSAATGNAYGMTFNPSGTKMYYLGADSLSFDTRFHIYNATTYTLITSISDTPLYRGLVALPDGSEVWVTIDGSFPTNSSIVRYSTTTDAIVGAPILTSQDAGAPFHMAVKPDGSKVYALLYSGDIDVITVASHTVTATVTMGGDFAGDLIINPAGTRLYASKTQGTKPYWVKVVDTATNTIIATVDSDSVTVPTPTTVGAFDTIRFVGAHVTDDGGGQAAVALPVLYDTGSVALTNIKANRSASNISINDQTKTGITNFGCGSTASGDYATIGGGQNNVASGLNATVPGGTGNTAKGGSSFASGDGSSADGYVGTALGSSITDPGSNYAMAVNSSRSKGFYSFSANDGSTAENQGSAAFNSSRAQANYSFTEGFGGVGLNSVASHSESSSFVDANSPDCHAEGSGYIDTGCNAAHAEGRNGYIWPNVRAGHVEGNNCEVKKDGGHAEGDSTHAEGYQSHAQNTGTHAVGVDSHAEGNGCYANGWYSHAQGGATTADGEGSCSEGDGTNAFGKWSHAMGSASKALRETQFAFSSGSNSYSGTGLGGHQTSWLTVRGTTGGGSTNESAVLQYGISSDLSDIILEDGKAYSFKVVAAIGGIQTGPVRVSRTIEIKFNVRRDGGVTTITASGTTEAYGDAATSTWTITPTVGVGPDRLLLTFNTGAGTASACGVCARVEFVETIY